MKVLRFKKWTRLAHCRHCGRYLLYGEEDIENGYGSHWHMIYCKCNRSISSKTYSVPWEVIKRLAKKGIWRKPEEPLRFLTGD